MPALASLTAQMAAISAHLLFADVVSRKLIVTIWFAKKQLKGSTLCASTDVLLVSKYRTPLYNFWFKSY